MDIRLIKAGTKVQAVRNGIWEANGRFLRCNGSSRAFVKFGNHIVDVLPAEIRLPVAYVDVPGKLKFMPIQLFKVFVLYFLNNEPCSL